MRGHEEWRWLGSKSLPRPFYLWWVFSPCPWLSHRWLAEPTEMSLQNLLIMSLTGALLTNVSHFCPRLARRAIYIQDLSQTGGLLDPLLMCRQQPPLHPFSSSCFKTQTIAQEPPPQREDHPTTGSLCNPLATSAIFPSRASGAGGETESQKQSQGMQCIPFSPDWHCLIDTVYMLSLYYGYFMVHPFPRAILINTVPGDDICQYTP